MNHKMEKYLWDVEAAIIRHGHSLSETSILIDPLVWYVSTGRASAEWCNHLMEMKPFVIARILEKGGSYNEAVDRLKKRVWRECTKETA